MTTKGNSFLAKVFRMKSPEELLFPSFFSTVPRDIGGSLAEKNINDVIRGNSERIIARYPQLSLSRKVRITEPTLTTETRPQAYAE